VNSTDLNEALLLFLTNKESANQCQSCGIAFTSRLSVKREKRHPRMDNFDKDRCPLYTTIVQAVTNLYFRSLAIKNDQFNKSSMFALSVKEVIAKMNQWVEGGGRLENDIQSVRNWQSTYLQLPHGADDFPAVAASLWLIDCLLTTYQGEFFSFTIFQQIH
jgi:hypothetical protein